MSSTMGATPRVTKQHLPQYVNKTVRIVGRVEQLRGDQATIDAEGSIQVHLNQDSHLQPNFACEIIGKVRPDGSVSVLQATDFGEKFDYASANAVVAATHKYPALFTTGANMTLDHSYSASDLYPAKRPKTAAERTSKVVENAPRPTLSPPPLTTAQSFDSDAQLLADELDGLEVTPELSPVHKAHTVSFEQDAQLLIDEIDTFELSQSLRTIEPEVSFMDVDSECNEHRLCDVRYERSGGQTFEVHAFTGEEQWLWVAKPPREKRRKSYV